MRHLTSHGVFQGFPGCARPVLLEPSTGLGRRSQVGFRVQLKVLGVLGVSLSSAKCYLLWANSLFCAVFCTVLFEVFISFYVFFFWAGFARKYSRLCGHFRFFCDECCSPPCRIIPFIMIIHHRFDSPIRTRICQLLIV